MEPIRSPIAKAGGDHAARNYPATVSLDYRRAKQVAKFTERNKPNRADAIRAVIDN